MLVLGGQGVVDHPEIPAGAGVGLGRHDVFDRGYANQRGFAICLAGKDRYQDSARPDELQPGTT